MSKQDETFNALLQKLFNGGILLHLKQANAINLGLN